MVIIYNISSVTGSRNSFYSKFQLDAVVNTSSPLLAQADLTSLFSSWVQISPLNELGTEAISAQGFTELTSFSARGNLAIQPPLMTSAFVFFWTPHTALLLPQQLHYME